MELKLNYLKSLEIKRQIIFTDDDNEVLKTVSNELTSVIVYQDFELID